MQKLVGKARNNLECRAALSVYKIWASTRENWPFFGAFDQIRLNLMRGSRKFCQRTLTTFLFYCSYLMEDPDTTISGPSSAFRWRADDDPTLNAGFVAL